MIFKFNPRYFILFLVLLITEIILATNLNSGFIRYTFGDYIVVLLIYCFLKSFIDLKPKYVAFAVLLIAFFIEFLQLFNILKKLNLQNNHLANLVLGSTFQIGDLIAYTLGIITILIIEYKIK